MIETTALSRHYDAKVALRALDLRVDPGEILGFLGPNGAGKSTTVKILTGMIKPTSGRAVVAGFDVVEQPLEVKKRIGYVPETAAIYDGLTANEYLELIACLHHLDPKTSASRRKELLDLFGLGGAADQRMTEFSKGMRQKVIIAAALMHRPDVLFLVERMCTRIVIINGGQTVASGTAAAIRESTGSASLEDAFSRLTGVRDVGETASDLLAALDRI